MRPNPAITGPFQRGDRILDKYEVRGLLGAGGHAFVYDCFNAFLAEEVAIKVIPNPGQRGGQLFKRARGEAQVLYRLNHPNVVRVMDGGELDGMAYIVMEKLDGVSLRQLLRGARQLSVVDTLLIALQAADALEAAHAMNVIHRDLKPDNIFVLPGNQVKVLDFGIAKFLEGGYQTTQKDLIQGTAAYMSPEQAQGLGVTFASDIFQLGTIMYEMMAGICPCMIGVEEPTLQLVVSYQIAKLPPRVKSRVASVPDYVDRLVWRAIAKQAQQRFATMREMSDAIRAALERLQVEAPAATPPVLGLPAHRFSSRPPRVSAAAGPLLVKTTPLALATPLVAQRASSGSVDTEPFPGHSALPTTTSPALVAKGPTPAFSADRAEAAELESRSRRTALRTLLLRAVVLGAIVALPVGLVLGLAKQRQAERLSPPTSSARSARSLPPGPASAEQATRVPAPSDHPAATLSPVVSSKASMSPSAPVQASKNLVPTLTAAGSKRLTTSGSTARQAGPTPVSLARPPAPPVYSATPPSRPKSIF